MKKNYPFLSEILTLLKRNDYGTNEEYTIRAKTGWTRENNINTGWWTGYIETKMGLIFLQQDFYKTEK